MYRAVYKMWYIFLRTVLWSVLSQNKKIKHPLAAVQYLHFHSKVTRPNIEYWDKAATQLRVKGETEPFYTA